eukprot:3785668-Amphidinium_carterae.1
MCIRDRASSRPSESSSSALVTSHVKKHLTSARLQQCNSDGTCFDITSSALPCCIGSWPTTLAVEGCPGTLQQASKQPTCL